MEKIKRDLIAEKKDTEVMRAIMKLDGKTLHRKVGNAFRRYEDLSRDHLKLIKRIQQLEKKLENKKKR